MGTRINKDAIAVAGDGDVRVLNGLGNGVKRAIEVLGSGFLANQKNATLRAAVESGKLDNREYYRQLIILVYRLIFLFVAEERTTLLTPYSDEAAESDCTTVYSTRRLRALSAERRDGQHRGIWNWIRTVMLRLSDGCFDVTVPRYGSFLWNSQACCALMGAHCSDEHVLNAIHCLSSIHDGVTGYQVNWGRIGADELGRIYEKLLEFDPQFSNHRSVFCLLITNDHERKATGSYYTPASLVDCLLNWTLDPVLDQAVMKPDPEHAILSLKVCDPACGSGNFLIAAARRIGKRLASIRAEQDEPDLREIRRAVRDVVARCIFGVDLDPLSIEICKIGLWLETIEIGKPLAVLDSHIQCGNALLGTTPELMNRGISDRAFKSIKGKHKTVENKLIQQNRRERKAIEVGQRTMFAEFESDEKNGMTAATQTSKDAESRTMTDATAPGVRQAHAEGLVRSAEYEDAWFRSDAWCAAFVWPKRSRQLAAAAITEERWRHLLRDGSSIPRLTRRTVNELALKYRFFHWHLAFPQVFNAGRPHLSEIESHATQRGFDVILGNPPFVNSIEGGISSGAKAILRAVSSDLRGTADLAFHFVQLAHYITNCNGRIGLVQPKTFLNADSAFGLREELRKERPPVLIYVPITAKYFAGVSAYVCLLVLAQGGDLQVSDSDSLADGKWHVGVLQDNNWWRAVQVILGNVPHLKSMDLVPMGTGFSIAASMTTGDAYAIKPYIREDTNGEDLRLVTTGLIDPFVCNWGKVPCRYLGDIYRRPCVLQTPGLPPALTRRLRNARRPKVLIAGLANRLEAFLDAEGNCCGAVSTFSVFDSNDNIDALTELSKWLNGEIATSLIRSELGAASVGGDYMTIKKQALMRLPMPKDTVQRSQLSGT